MYNKGEYIIYGNNGVCMVKDYMQSESMGEGQVYYVLVPLSSRGSTIFSPVDNKKVFMRPVISKSEAEELIEGIPGYEDMVIADVRPQEQQYKEILQEYDCTVFLRFIKALYGRKKERESMGRKITAVDEKYLLLAKDSLLNELSVALEMEVDEVDRLLFERMTAGEE
ncbi:MAG: CarD family transcriptional regulator [Eubacterium sp.]|nr:CarD family transcriptional regulator [Eubacterium sp.]